jgi:hypothetical protein
LGTADIGAWTIGCSIPSSSQTGVRIDTTHPFVPVTAPATGLDADLYDQRWQIHIQL